jgi:ubiquinone/menaquinone biosynthesis methyltransferase
MRTPDSSFKDPITKKEYTKELFSVVAPCYNNVTRFLSFWQDKKWKKALIAALDPLDKPRCLDLACGTGDITFALACRYKQGTIIGLDITPAMLEYANKLNTFPHVSFICEDMCHTNIQDSSIDILTGGYALRNAPDLHEALNEVKRVLKPKGIAAFLDFAKPVHPIMQAIQYGLLNCWGSLWGLIMHRRPHVYAYIAKSLTQYPDQGTVIKLLNHYGFEIIKVQQFFFGMVHLVVVRKI